MKAEARPEEQALERWACGRVTGDGAGGAGGTKDILRVFQRQREELRFNSEEKTLIGTKMIETGLKDSSGRGGQGKLEPGKTEC